MGAGRGSPRIIDFVVTADFSFPWCSRIPLGLLQCVAQVFNRGLHDFDPFAFSRLSGSFFPQHSLGIVRIDDRQGSARNAAGKQSLQEHTVMIRVQQFNGQPAFVSIVGIRQTQHRHTIVLTAVTQKMENVRHEFTTQSFENARRRRTRSFEQFESLLRSASAVCNTPRLDPPVGTMAKMRKAPRMTRGCQGSLLMTPRTGNISYSCENMHNSIFHGDCHIKSWTR